MSIRNNGRIRIEDEKNEPPSSKEEVKLLLLKEFSVFSVDYI